MNVWSSFAAKHPAAAKWVREGGLFVIVGNLDHGPEIPASCSFSRRPLRAWATPVDFGWPGIPSDALRRRRLSGTSWATIRPTAAWPYFCAYMVAMVIGECINFPIQRNFVFRSPRAGWATQIAWYRGGVLHHHLHRQLHQLHLGCGGRLVLCPTYIYNIGTTVLNGGISMVVFFFVNKIIFPSADSTKKAEGKAD